MGISDLRADEPAPFVNAASEDMAARGMVPAIFAAAIVVSAALLFLVQPMFTKLVLPRFGGAPSVWSVAMVFFQCTLLAGYAYAHWLMRTARRRIAVAIHVLLMIAACLWLSLPLPPGWGAPPPGGG